MLFNSDQRCLTVGGCLLSVCEVATSKTTKQGLYSIRLAA